MVTDAAAAVGWPRRAFETNSRRSMDDRSNQTCLRQPPHGPLRRSWSGAVAGADERQRASENGADGGALPGFAQGRQTVRRLQTLHRAQRLQVGRRRHIAEGMVRAMGQEGLTLKLGLRLPRS